MGRFAVFISLFISAQSWTTVEAQTPLIPDYNRGFEIMRRWIIQGRIPPTPPGFSHEVERRDLYFALHSLPSDTTAVELNSGLMSRDNRYLYNASSSLSLYLGERVRQNPPNGWRSIIYPYPNALLQGESTRYYVQLNPLLSISGGCYRDSTGALAFENTRGLEIEGAFDHRFFFYSRIVETQKRLLPHEADYVDAYHALPPAGTFKPYESRFLPQTGGVDFNGSTGYFGMQVSPSFQIKVGQGRHFIGSGYRSLLLSDFGKDYFYGQMDWRLGPLFYRNIYTSMIARTRIDLNRDALLPKKYMAAHLLGVTLPYGIQIALYEAVVHSRNNRFELSYLNPIIFYKSLEFNLGSPDNALIGGDIRWDIAHVLRLYGQLIIDEFNLRYLKDYKEGWWGNKFGLQWGVFYPDVFSVQHLDLRMEYNIVRPYTYTHRDSIRSYAHYNQPLAHPWGANFREFITEISYQPNNRWEGSLRWISGCRGLDNRGENNGSNILVSHLNNVRPFGNFVCQGERHRVTSLLLQLTYRCAHNYFIDITRWWRYEMVGRDNPQPRGFAYWSLGLRANLGITAYDY